MQIKTVYSEFLFDCELRHFTQKTMKGYRNNLSQFFNYLDEKYSIQDIEEVTARQIKDFFKELWKNGRKVTYTNGLLKVFRAFFKYALQEEYIKINPCDKVPWGKEDITLIKTFSDAEVKRMLDAFNGCDYMAIRNKAIIAMLVDTGIRNNELCELNVDSIFDCYINIFGKGSKERMVGISPYLQKCIIKYLNVRNGYFIHQDVGDTFFLSRSGRKLTVEAVERIVAKAGKVADVDGSIRCSPHTLRHYFAQAQLRNNLDIYSLARLMGHNNIKITQRYLQSMQDKDVIERGIRSSPIMNLR